jgi:hypothetical protein
LWNSQIDRQSLENGERMYNISVHSDRLLNVLQFSM